jgi:hypothetical protein
MSNDLQITDSHSTEYLKSFDFFYPPPKIAQDLSQAIFKTIFTQKIEPFSFGGLFNTTLNRNFLSDIKIVEHPLILQNIIDHCRKYNYSVIHFTIHRSNIELYNYYQVGLIYAGIQSNLIYHDNKHYWKNSLTKESLRLRVFNGFKLWCVVLAQTFLLIINSCLFWRRISGGNILFWHSFANNREKVDYTFLDELENQKGFKIIHPNPYKLISSTNWNKSMYFLNGYTIRPFKYIKAVLELFRFKSKFNSQLSQYSDLLSHIPTKWNSSSMTKAFLFTLYNLLETGLLENIAKCRNVKSLHVFRGGSAAGLIYSGIAKMEFNPSKMINILVPHGTEYNLLDHYSYFFLDYNVLPSELIVENWNKELNEKMLDYQSYNRCKLIAGGRIDYEPLNSFIPKSKSDLIHIGIVLTYSTDLYQENYLDSIIRTFESFFGINKCVFVIKPRPNVAFDSTKLRKPNVIIFNNDIYSFLSTIDLVIGTVSSYGSLSMVVTDAIYCRVPALYYILNPRFNKNNLGYTYHQSMEEFTFNDELELEKYLKDNLDFPSLLTDLAKKNSQTFRYLKFDKNAFDFLKLFISKAF